MKAYVERIAGAAATATLSSHKGVIETAHGGYQALVDRLTAIRDGAGDTIEQAVGAGRTVLKGADDLRQWFWSEGRVRV